jgi:hypothetical protein
VHEKAEKGENAIELSPMRGDGGGWAVDRPIGVGKTVVKGANRPSKGAKEVRDRAVTGCLGKPRYK